MDKNQLIIENFSFLFEDSLINELKDIGKIKKVSQGEYLMDIGQEMTFMPLLISGAIKVFRTDEEGDEYILYFIEGGDTCAMTLNCCMRGAKSEIKAVAEVDTMLLLVPISKMEDWLHYKSWRIFVFGSYNNRMKEMLEAIDSLAFMNMNERVLKYLKDKVVINKDEILTTTHNIISDELNTSRVVISRILKKLEKDGELQLLRNQIKILRL
jgi:CRP/FNR family transcriptional regulator|tara:strand:- start:61 stop:696 length:636 start_codon:yes stop_codon:yes gene_type:complete